MKVNFFLRSSKLYFKQLNAVRAFQQLVFHFVMLMVLLTYV